MLTWRIGMGRAHVVLQGRHVLRWVGYIKGYSGRVVPPAPQVMHSKGYHIYVRHNNPSFLTCFYVEDCEVVAKCIWVLISRFVLRRLMMLFAKKIYIPLAIWLYRCSSPSTERSV